MGPSCTSKPPVCLQYRALGNALKWSCRVPFPHGIANNGRRKSLFRLDVLLPPEYSPSAKATNRVAFSSAQARRVAVPAQDGRGDPESLLGMPAARVTAKLRTARARASTRRRRTTAATVSNIVHKTPYKHIYFCFRESFYNSKKFAEELAFCT